MNIWRRLQRTAWVLRTLLFVWLFGLAAGWANACVLQARFDAHHGALGHDADTAGHPHPSSPVARAIVDDGGAAAEVCLSLCDGERSAIPKLKLVVPGDPGLHQAALAAPWLPWSVAPAPERARAVAMPPPPGPPVAIRFLRLTR